MCHNLVSEEYVRVRSWIGKRCGLVVAEGYIGVCALSFPFTLCRSRLTPIWRTLSAPCAVVWWVLTFVVTSNASNTSVDHVGSGNTPSTASSLTNLSPALQKQLAQFELSQITDRNHATSIQQ